MLQITYHKDISKMNTFGMKVSAHCLVEFDSIADLFDIDFDLDSFPKPLKCIGGGSNLLFTDDFKGTLIHSKINYIELMDRGEHSEFYANYAKWLGRPLTGDDVLVSVGSGVVFDDFCGWAASHGIWGLENLSGIPGEVGASAVQNIGAYGVEVKDVIYEVQAYDIVNEQFVKFPVRNCDYAYRDSYFKHDKDRFIIVGVVFALSRKAALRLEYGHIKEAVTEALELVRKKNPAAEITPGLIRKVITRIRDGKLPDPAVMGSAGSFFKNPVVTKELFAKIEAGARKEHGEDYIVPHYIVVRSGEDGSENCEMVKVPAAWMIEQCGWKGRRSGGAAVYDKQPLVIVNYTGNAYPEEIVGLERRIIESVKARFGVELSPEVEHL